MVQCQKRRGTMMIVGNIMHDRVNPYHPHDVKNEPYQKGEEQGRDKSR